MLTLSGLVYYKNSPSISICLCMLSSKCDHYYLQNVSMLTGMLTLAFSSRCQCTDCSCRLGPATQGWSGMHCVKVQISRQPQAPGVFLLTVDIDYCAFHKVCDSTVNCFQHLNRDRLDISMEMSDCVCTQRAVDQSLLTDISQLRLTIQLSESLTCWHCPAAAPVTQRGPLDLHRHSCSHTDGLTEKSNCGLLWVILICVSLELLSPRFRELCMWEKQLPCATTI